MANRLLANDLVDELFGMLDWNLHVLPWRISLTLHVSRLYGRKTRTRWCGRTDSILMSCSKGLAMADTATLKPLTSREKLELSPDSDRDLLEQARERFALAEEAEATERSQQLDAFKFRAGDHWPAALRQDNMGEALSS